MYFSFQLPGILCPPHPHIHCRTKTSFALFISILLQCLAHSRCSISVAWWTSPGTPAHSPSPLLFTCLFYLPALSDLCPVVNALSQVSACTLASLDSHPSPPALLLLLTWHARLPEGNLLFWLASAVTALLLICPWQPFILRSEGSEGALLLVSPGGQEKLCTFYVNMVIWGWECNPCCVLGPSEPQLHPENML